MSAGTRNHTSADNHQIFQTFRVNGFTRFLGCTLIVIGRKNEKTTETMTI